MTTTLDHDQSPRSIGFHDARWRTRWLIVGLIFLLLWRCSVFVDREWLERIPWWVILIGLRLGPQVFLMVFPICTMRLRKRTRMKLPSARRVLIEFGIAIPIVVAVLAIGLIANEIMERISPGSSLVPHRSDNMMASANRLYVYGMLVFSFTFAPIAEEVFFRGFLHNAFRARMPIVAAVILQCLIFGFAHFYGLPQAVVLLISGLLLTGVYAWRKTLATPIFVHAGVNLFSAVGVILAMHAYDNRATIGIVGDPSIEQCVILDVVPGLPAEQAGLVPGDIVTSIDGEPIRDFTALKEALLLHRAGDVVYVTISRDGSYVDVAVKLTKRGGP